MKLEKTACPVWQISKRGGVGSERKILCPAGCQNRRSRITKAKEILKNPQPAGRQRPFKCIFSGKEKRPSTAGRKPRPVRSMYGKARQGQSAAVTEQVSTTVPKSAILRFCPSRETCWGVPSPNPAMRLAPQKRFPSGEKFFSLSPRKWLTDKSIFCDK